MLEVIADGAVYRVSDLADPFADHFQLTEEERTERIRNGRLRFSYRIDWVCTDLQKAGLIESAGRGQVRITQSGLAALRDGPSEFSDKYLLQFSGYADWVSGRTRSRVAEAPTEAQASVASADASPEETLEAIYEELRQQLAVALLERIKGCSPQLFEKPVVDLLVAMGYGGSRHDAGRAIGRSGDGGIDGIIKEDKLGLDAVYLQAKRWEGVVGRPEVQAFAGSLEGMRARKGVMITTSRFSQAAHEYVNIIEKRIVLIDGNELADLMIEHNVGVAMAVSYAIKRMDLDYFDEG